MGATTTLEEIVGILGDGYPREHKIQLYCAHGSKSVWVIYPEMRIVQIFDASGCGKRFERDQPLTDPAVLPSFNIPTSAIFEGV